MDGNSNNDSLINDSVSNTMHQYLISFQQKTYVLNNIPSPLTFQSSSWKTKTNTNSNNEFPEKLISILQRRLSQKLNLIPSNKPHASNAILPLQINIQEITSYITYINASFKNSQILGGKGGFGTLLKGQSKRAPNKVTLNFNACRDLNGRRLRFVNEELKMQALTSDASKNYNASGWYLDIVPNWSGVSTKAMRRNEIKRKRDMEEVRKRLEDEKAEKERKKKENESKVMEYVNYEDNDMNMMKGSTYEDNSMEQIVLQSLLKKRKKLKEEEENNSTVKEEENDAKVKASIIAEQENNIADNEETEDNNNLCTIPWLGILAGEIQQINNTQEKEKNKIHLKSTSEFATGCILLPPHNHQNIIYYYEITLKTSGLIQIGWTLPSFSPKTINDGIGDDDASYGYDGSRQLLFHNNNEIPYGSKSWKEGDVIGSYYNPAKKIIGYYCNGEHLGIAFDNVNVGEKNDVLYPAFSLNFDQEIEIAQKEDCLYCPKDCIPIQKIINGSYFKELEMSEKKASVDETTATTATTTNTKTVEDKVITTSTKNESSKSMQKDEKEKTNQIIDLNKYSSSNELHSFGLETLKYNLQILGCKCGGTLEERAKRLFSLKGLEYKDYPKKVLAKK